MTFFIFCFSLIKKLAYHWQHDNTFTKHKFLLLHNKVWFKWTLQNLSIFGNFAVPKCLGISKRLNDRSLKLLQNIYFYFYKKSFIQMNWQNSSIIGYFAVLKGLGISKRLIDRSPKLLPNIYFYFYTIEFDSNELYKICHFLAILPSPKV